MTLHCTGAGVAPLLNLVLHPGVRKSTAVEVPSVRVIGDWAVMMQVPAGGAGVGGTGVTVGGHGFHWSAITVWPTRPNSITGQ